MLRWGYLYSVIKTTCRLRTHLSIMFVLIPQITYTLLMYTKMSCKEDILLRFPTCNLPFSKQCNMKEKTKLYELRRLRLLTSFYSVVIKLTIIVYILQYNIHC